jgi:protein-disulfide isomerase
MEDKKNVLTIPMAIVVAGIIIGGAIFFSRSVSTKEIFKQPEQPTAQAATAKISGNISLRAVSESDHISGNPGANIVMVEYSDLECPFCKSFHKTMLSLLDEYGKSGKLAWVYRHFPLDFHPKSPKESEATECAFELAGNTGFWNYVNKIFEITPANNGLDLAKLPENAKQIGLDVNAFQSCLDSGKYAVKVKADYDDGLKAGVNGTPHTILVLNSPLTAAAEKRLVEINQNILQQMQPGSPSLITVDSAKRKVGISGAFQYPMMKEIVDLILSGK